MDSPSSYMDLLSSCMDLSSSSVVIPKNIASCLKHTLVLNWLLSVPVVIVRYMYMYRGYVFCKQYWRMVLLDRTCSVWL